jgi:hypothetical protein
MERTDWDDNVCLFVCQSVFASIFSFIGSRLSHEPQVGPHAAPLIDFHTPFAHTDLESLHGQRGLPYRSPMEEKAPVETILQGHHNNGILIAGARP